MVNPLPFFTDEEIVALRPAKHTMDARRPYAYLVERERTTTGHIEDVATIFLTNRECPFRCLMCDLWQHTTDVSVKPGDIPAQIEYALEQLPVARHIKLYNSGSFFDRKAIPPADYPEIVRLVRNFDTVIVENHPNLCGDDCLRFRDLITGNLEVALGLETCHPEILERLNKRMSLEDFQRAVTFLRREEVLVRTFILLRPPFMSEEEGLAWAVRSIEFAFDAGAQCCAVIPTRAGNGIMERLQDEGLYEPPGLHSIESALEEGLRLRRGRVFVDLWGLERFHHCSKCFGQRKERLHKMNLLQVPLPAISCECK